MERFSLSDAADRVVKTYSGGMRRRLDLAVSLVATPPVLFLDEPTTGLDPRSRVELWEVLRELVSDGTTLVLTTQYLEEADQLADEIVVIDHGHIIAQGTPLQLKDQSGAAAVVVTVSHGDDLLRAEALLRELVPDVHVDEGARQLSTPAAGLGDMTRIATAFDGSGIELDDLGLKRPSLDDVFLRLTGHRAEETVDGSDLDRGELGLVHGRIVPATREDGRDLDGCGERELVGHRAPHHGGRQVHDVAIDERPDNQVARVEGRVQRPGPLPEALR